MKKTFYLYHGDLDFFKVDSLPKTAKLVRETKQHIPQHSDSTGHSHVITSDQLFKVYEYKGDLLYQFAAPANISHEEHRTEDFEPGVYLLQHELEEDPRSGLITEVQD